MRLPATLSTLDELRKLLKRHKSLHGCQASRCQVNRIVSSAIAELEEL